MQKIRFLFFHSFFFSLKKMTGNYLSPDIQANGGLKSHTIVDSGYNDNVFAGKNDQMVQVGEYLENSGFLPKELVQNEVSWFYG
jgi:glutamate dehydrogenase